MRTLYSILHFLLLPAAFIRLYWRGRANPAYRKRWKERLGYAPFELSNCIWVHAVSLGETIAAVPLIKYLQKKYPNQPLLVTNMTPTGSAHTQRVFGNSVYNCYLPYDVPHCLKRFLNRIHPSLLILMETELWPNLIYHVHQAQVPIILANARLSARSAKGYGRFKSLFSKMINQLNGVAAQHNDDAQRFIALGLLPEKLCITGSIKFDITPPANIQETATALRTPWGNRPVWIAGSTHEGEEQYILTAHRRILVQYPETLLILVPRHPERFAAVKTLCDQLEFTTVTRRSEQVCTPETSVFLGDTIGEMMLFYASADVAFVGGSFVEVGGHNLLEPASLAKPGLTGPFFFNFSDITKQLINAQAVYQVNCPEELAARVIELFSNPEKCQQMGANGLKIVMQNRGALQKLCDFIETVTQR